MGKRLSGLLLSVLWVISISVYAAGNPQLFSYKELGWDTPRTSAETAFSVRFSDSRIFNCYKNGKAAFELGVGVPVENLRSGKALETQYTEKYHASFNWQESAAYIDIEMWIETKTGKQPAYVSAGKPLFDSNDNLKYMVVELLNGKKVEFTRFGSIPDFPFNTRKKLKPFFYYQAEGEQRYECGATNQPD